MIASKKFLNQPKTFWAQVKLISMSLGYSGKDNIKVYSAEEIAACLEKKGLKSDHIIKEGVISTEGKLLVDYFIHRSKSLNECAKTNLMKREEAKAIFEDLLSKSKVEVSIPYNKQKGDKRHYAYLTGIVSILTANTLGHANFDNDPRSLIVITNEQEPIQTLSRRVDGAFPSTTNPKAIWEIKEYYGTTTFGSRVADGVYETLLDGYELRELEMISKIRVGHYLIVDDRFTWWECGKSYLCRMVDMMHEGFVDEVIFGKEVLTRWPEIVKKWK